MTTERLAQLKAKLRASLQYPGGPPLGGYKERVEKLRAEIARLEGANG